MDTLKWLLNANEEVFNQLGLDGIMQGLAGTVYRWFGHESELILKAGVTAAIMVGCWFYLRRTFRRHWMSREGMPGEIRTAKLLMSEMPIACSAPTALHGTPDQVYKLKSGQLVPVDTKTGSGRVYLSVIVQLSVYRTILISRGHCVAPYGYVRLVEGGNVRYERVDLWSPQRVVDLKERREQIKCGAIEPRSSRNARLCAGCHYRTKCDKSFA
tara:strand:+ start:531 stop:1172 length:642 start_codon:yes stop_codon:yes gene_type:complete